MRAPAASEFRRKDSGGKAGDYSPRSSAILRPALR